MPKRQELRLRWPPKPMVRLDPKKLIREMQKQRDGMSSPLGFIIEKAIRVTNRMSTTPLSGLSPIRIQKMQINEWHRGKYLLCRIVSPAYSFTCPSFAVEDEDEWVIQLILENFPHGTMMPEDELDTVFPQNTVMAIREPFVQQVEKFCGFHIRIHCPSDIVFLDPSDPLVMKASWSGGNRSFGYPIHTDAQWKEIGNKHFRAKEYFGAVVAYAFGLQQNKVSTVLRLNRALGNLRLGNFSAALADSKDVLATPEIGHNNKVKALYRAGQAAYGQRDYIGAQDYYSQCLIEEPNSGDSILGLDKCKARIKEAETGIYDWLPMYKLSTTPAAYIDVADYQGPIKIVEMVNRRSGRGVVATRDIKRGEILVVSKAIASADRQNYNFSDTFITMNCQTNGKEKNMVFMAIQDLISKTYAEPRLAAEVSDLYAGADFPRVPAANFVADGADFYKNPLRFSYDIDVGRIEQSLLLNYPRTLKRAEEDGPITLWILPSYFNHSCIPNAAAISYCDIQVVIANQKIFQGEEITMCLNTSESYRHRKVLLADFCDECNCKLCKEDRADEPHLLIQRDNLIIKAQKEKGENMTESEARKLLDEIKKTYSRPRSTLCPGIANAYHVLFGILLRRPVGDMAHRHEVVRVGIAFLEASGMPVTDKQMEEIPPQSSANFMSYIPLAEDCTPYGSALESRACVTIAKAFLAMGRPRRAKLWLRAAVWVEHTAYSGGIPCFRYSNYKDLDSYPTLLSYLAEM